MIHKHWKELKLNDKSSHEEVKVEEENDNEIDTEIAGILRRYKKTDVLQKQEIRRKLREVMDPTLTQTIEPLVPPKLKGRPKGSYKRFDKEYKSTKRELSLYEHVLLGEEKVDVKIGSTKMVKNDTRLIKRVQKQMPLCVSKYIMNVVDAPGDGHCGYHVVSRAVELDDDWQKVRHALTSELVRYEHLYTDIYGHSRRLELLESLDCIVTPAPMDKWMTMPDMGLVVASFYNIKFIHYSKFQSFTFLPLHSAPPPFPKTVYIGFINDNHFVQLLMHDECPLPPIFPSWARYHEEIASKWGLKTVG